MRIILIALPLLLVITGCAGSIPRLPPSLHRDAYADRLVDFPRVPEEGTAYARVLGVRPTKDGLYVDFCVTSSNAPAAAGDIAATIMRHSPSDFLTVADNGHTITLEPPMLDTHDFVPRFSLVSLNPFGSAPQVAEWALTPPHHSIGERTCLKTLMPRSPDPVSSAATAWFKPWLIENVRFRWSIRPMRLVVQ